MAAKFCVSAILHDARERTKSPQDAPTSSDAGEKIDNSKAVEVSPWLILELCHVEVDSDHFVDAHHEQLEVIAAELGLPGREQAEMLVPLALFARILAVLHMNVMSVFNEPLTQTTSIPEASILPFLGSFFNHDCEPNASLIHPLDPDRCVWFEALREIDPGEEICITYVDQAMPQEEKQRHLEWAYGFRCTCQACLEAESKPK